jgi:hypothetical protein
MVDRLMVSDRGLRGDRAGELTGLPHESGEWMESLGTGLDGSYLTWRGVREDVSIMMLWSRLGRRIRCWYEGMMDVVEDIDVSGSW